MYDRHVDHTNEITAKIRLNKILNHPLNDWINW